MEYIRLQQSLLPFVYNVIVISNNKCIGTFERDVDGYYNFWSDGDGSWSDYTLIELGTKLKELNKDWNEQIHEYFKKENGSIS